MKINVTQRHGCVLALLLIAGTVGVQAQGTSTTLNGSVVDKEGKAIAKADVVVTNDATSGSRKTTCGDDGRFTVSGLTPGIYRVEASASGFAPTMRTDVRLGGGELDISISLAVATVSQVVTVEAVESIAAESAPMQSSLETHSAKSEISQAFVENFTSPFGDYSEVLLMSPGTFSVNPNGVGLGQAKDYFRGFPDGDYTMQFDGIPFEDTNSPTHHTWALFPGTWIGQTEFDRSPGTASTIGPTNFGGTINLMSREVPTSMGIQGSISYGSFSTRLLDLGLDTGLFGPGNRSSFMVDVHDLRSNGYQTENHQHRDAGQLKYQYRISDRTTVTLYTNLVDLWTNTPNTTAPTRAQVAQFGDNYLLSGDPTNPYYWAINFYHVQTNFSYFGYHSDLGKGWKADNKVYSYHYWNKQNYNNSATVGQPATVDITNAKQFTAVDKLNGYTKFGDTFTLSHESKYGIFSTGFWYEWAYTDRYQVPSIPTVANYFDATLGNFHEHFLTSTFQPYLQYEWRATRKLSITGGVRWSYYDMDLTQYADNGKTVGCLGGTLTQVVKGVTNVGTEFCAGGAPWTKHGVQYPSVEPSLDARYRLLHGWSVYGQYASGSIIPPSNIFDVKNAAVEKIPGLSRTNTYQIGSVFKKKRMTLDVDAYYVRFQNAYTSYTDPVTTEPVYTLPGDSRTKGIEAESNIYLGKGISLYLNASAGKAFYVNSGLWVASTPANMQTVGLLYQHKAWDFGFFNKRVGPMWNDNGAFNQSIPIDPFELTNLYLNYTVKESSLLRGTKFRLAINNLQNSHAITGITAGTVSQIYTISPSDVITMLPARSVTLTVTMGIAPRK